MIAFFLSFLFLLIVSPFFPNHCYAYTFEKTFKLPPIKLTYEDLNSINTFLLHQLAKINTSEKQEDTYQLIRISGGDVTLEKEGTFLLSKDDPLPDVSRDLYLVYRNKSGPITYITYNFSDLERKLSIQGISNEYVESIHLLLLDKFSNKSFYAGGQQFRMIIFIILVIIGAFIYIFASNYNNLSNMHRIGFIILGLFIFLLGIILGLGNWFPGFGLYKDSTSFIIKYSAEISFISLIITIAFFPIGIYFSRRFSIKSKVSSED
jgi:hypothetical protein